MSSPTPVSPGSKYTSRTSSQKLIRCRTSHEETDAWFFVSELDFDNLPRDQTGFSSRHQIRRWSNAILLSSCILFLLNDLYSYWDTSSESFFIGSTTLQIQFPFYLGLVSSISANEGKHLTHLQWSEMTQRKCELSRVCVCTQPQTTSLWLSFACALCAVSSWSARQQVGFDFQLKVLNISCTVSVI